jgi:thioredoxin reductase (NADPH)
MEKRKVIIIGSGPAGLTAALYTARANLRPLVLEGFQSGGQLMTTTEVENYPGFEDGVTGPELIEKLRKQAEKFGAEFITEDVTRVELEDQRKIIYSDDEQYEAETVIIATGASANYLGLENELRLKGRGVSACATCDGFFFKNKVICVIGGGDSAMEEAIFLTRFASKVYIIHRRDELRASKIMGERAMKNDKIEFILNSVPRDVLGKEKVEGILLYNNKTSRETELKVDGIFLGIGHTPNTAIFKGVIETDKAGYILTSTEKSRCTATNKKGVFACGDVQDSKYQQAITAAGSGCMAALDAEKYLEEKE